ncbi:hypothetical protein F3N42_00690 [Marinihelvus fidelis]|uniref:Uncharacterized protein n=1 Tax=Marinihelvus fidelis TaxID=2613842 RepID=A0A5N0THY5_9GAMM|nr:hypothetical protein [Marinihelvus fidelis]KAA9134098.1 hypothetical protein F3N42_00690 [Marinihelvus fidelis]
MSKTTQTRTLLATAGTLLLLSSTAWSAGNGAAARDLNALRQATSAFHSFEVGKAAGWDTPLSDCVESPEGGMGYHYANLSLLMDGGSLSVLHPEVLLYAPTEDGSMAFVGVEYIIPAADWTDAAPPRFLGHDLHYNPVQDIWALHAWVGEQNPSGVLSNWNPRVSCEFAD